MMIHLASSGGAVINQRQGFMPASLVIVAICKDGSRCSTVTNAPSERQFLLDALFPHAHAGRSRANARACTPSQARECHARRAAA